MSAKEKLEEIGSFKDNWNGYGAEAYSEMFIKFASDTIDMLPVEPEVFPIANGGIQLEIKVSLKREIEIELKKDFTIDCTLYDGDEDIRNKVNVSRKDLPYMIGIWFSMKDAYEFPRM